MNRCHLSRDGVKGDEVGGKGRFLIDEFTPRFFAAFYKSFLLVKESIQRNILHYQGCYDKVSIFIFVFLLSDSSIGNQVLGMMQRVSSSDDMHE